MAKMNKMKVFDCQDMPGDLCDYFLRRDLGGAAGNNCYVDWYINASSDADESTKEIDQWLVKNGAKPAKNINHEGEHVLIKFWW